MAGGELQKKRHHHESQGGVPFEKSKGQHILKNPMLVETIVQKSGIKPTDVVLEIGPETGNLTNKLLQVAKSFVAVEVDPRMVLELNRRFQGAPFATRLKVIQEDVLKCELPTLTSVSQTSPTRYHPPSHSRYYHTVQMCRYHVPTRVCYEIGREPRRQPLLPALSEHPAPSSNLPSPQSGPEQFQAST